MTKNPETTERVRSIKTKDLKFDYSAACDAGDALENFGYSTNDANVLVYVLHELRADGPTETAAAFRLFRKIAGVTRKPRMKKEN